VNTRPELPRGLFAGTTAVVVDTGNYYPARDGRIDAIDEGLADSEWVGQILGRPVVKAFNNILATSLDSRGTPEGTPGRVCLSVAGDEPAAKQKVLRLIGEPEATVCYSAHQCGAGRPLASSSSRAPR
jgi:hypothetical protein